VHSPLAGSILDYLDAVIRVLELGFHPRACRRIKMSPIAGSRADTDQRFTGALAAQKIALETDETAALKVANKFGESPPAAKGPRGARGVPGRLLTF
jgi:hypothetical protein